MTESALPMRPEAKLSGWRGHLTALAIIASAILALFHRDLLGMMAIWWNSSTYGHWQLVPILVAWLAR